MSCTFPVKIAFVVAGSIFILSGCADSLDRSDGIKKYAGSSVSANLAIHERNPWPRSSLDKNISPYADRSQEAPAQSQSSSNGTSETQRSGMTSGSTSATR